jgi:hypothetical protein
MDTTTPPVVEQNSGSLNLVLGDIAAVVNIIDKVARRGAFEGSELSDVGALRLRFITFLEAVNRLNAEANPQPKPDNVAAAPAQDSEGTIIQGNFPTK